MDIYLETERLILRRFTPDDIDHLVELDSDPEVMRFISGGRATPREIVEGRILPMILQFYERPPGLGFWAAIEKASGEFVGWFCLRPHEERGPGVVGLGYRLRRAVWGRGYATEGSRALVDKAFAEAGVRLVFATTYEENIGSRRVMERAGLRFVRAFRFTEETSGTAATYEDDEDSDPWPGEDVEYALEREEWERSKDAARDR